jgi:hypothetical protein
MWNFLSASARPTKPETKRLRTTVTSIELLSQSHSEQFVGRVGFQKGRGGGEESASSSRIRIVDGKIVRSDENSAEAATACCGDAAMVWQQKGVIDLLVVQ